MDLERGMLAGNKHMRYSIPRSRKLDPEKTDTNWIGNSLRANFRRKDKNTDQKITNIN